MPEIPDDARELLQHEIQTLRRRFALRRRGFFRLLGNGVLVGWAAAGAAAQESGRFRPSWMRHPLSQNISAWLHIAPSGAVTVYTGKVEVGQNIRTSLAQQVAEELRVPLAAIRMVMGDTRLTPFDMGTFGSRTTPTMGPQLRKAAASARAILIELAARRWQTSASGLVAEEGRIRDPKTGNSVGYGALTRGQRIARAIAADPELTPAERWRVAGHSAPKVDGRLFVTGAHRYPADQVVPGMLIGKVVRPSAFHARLVECDVSGAQAISGARVVRDGDFIGVVAPDQATAVRAAAQVRARWRAPRQIGNRELFDALRRTARNDAGHFEQTSGAAPAVSAGRLKRLQASYEIAYIAHAPLEPRAALAVWRHDHLTVWTGTQRPFGVQQELASAFHLPLKNVRVLMPDTGAAFGGKHTGEAAVEAARLARGAGRPVKLIWTREEEFTWAYFRPAGVIDINAAVDDDGRIAAWEFDNFNSGPAAIGTPYRAQYSRIAFHPCDPPLRQGSYRSLAACANHFARESHMDDLARLAGIDPLEFRLKNIPDPRLRAVFRRAAARFGWARRRRLPGRRGYGLACGFEKGGYVATCAEVEISGQDLRIARVTEAWDSGAVINPNGLRNQIEGAILMGIGGALREAIQFENGRILNPRFSQYRVPRFADLPGIEVVLVDRKNEKSFGAGETPIVGIAPAVANAICDATGMRLRSLPMLVDGRLPATV